MVDSPVSLASVVPWEERQAGDIGGLHGKSTLSDAIIEGERLAGEMPSGAFQASHIFIVSDGHIFEAIWPKISLTPWNVYDGQETRLYRLAVPDSWKTKALLSLQSQWVGQHYDVLGVVGMGFLEIERQIMGGALSHNLLASQHKVWCSELGTDYLKLVLSSDTALPKATDPQQVVNYLESLCS